MKYRIQRQTEHLNSGRKKWTGYESFDADSDLEAFAFLLDRARSIEQRSNEPSTVCLRLIDQTDSVVAFFAPNPSKLPDVIPMDRDDETDRLDYEREHR